MPGRSVPIHIGGQRGWAHDEGHPAGTFHTFDALDVGTRFGPRKVHVMLPRDYERSNRRYPTVYLHDGDTAFWRGGVANQTWDVAGALSELGRRVREVIVVAIHPVQRDAEYTHVDWGEGRRPYGRLAEHADYLADEVARFVDAHYPTDPDPRSRVIVGSSHGGLAAFWTATRRPDVFRKAGCLSPSFFSGLDSLVTGARPVPLLTSELVQGAVPVLADPERRPMLWICWGMRRDGGEHNEVVEALAAWRGQQMIDILIGTFGYRHGVDLFTWVDREGGHDEASWHGRFARMMEAFFPVRTP